jgi:hypothetical protein
LTIHALHALQTKLGVASSAEAKAAPGSDSTHSSVVTSKMIILNCDISVTEHRGARDIYVVWCGAGDWVL